MRIGEIKDGEQTAQSLICNDCQKLFRDGKSVTFFHFTLDSYTQNN